MNILLVRLGRLGDVVMILPALRALQARYPTANFYAITTGDGVRILKKAGILPEHCFVHQTRWYGRSWSFRQMQVWLQQHPWDKIFVFETKPRTLKHLPATAAVMPETEWNPSFEHYSERCLRFVEPEQTLWPTGPFLHPSVEKMRLMQQSLLEFGVDENTLLIGFHPTYSGFNQWGKNKEKIHRLWPVANFVELANLLTTWADAQGVKLKIVMDLLPSERKIGQEIQRRSNNQVILLPAKKDFDLYLCYLQRLNVLVVPNTGVMHLASVLQTPTVALFSKHKSFYSGPWMPKNKYRILKAEDTANPERGLSAIVIKDVFKELIVLLLDKVDTLKT